MAWWVVPRAAAWSVPWAAWDYVVRPLAPGVQQRKDRARAGKPCANGLPLAFLGGPKPTFHRTRKPMAVKQLDVDRPQAPEDGEEVRDPETQELLGWMVPTRHGKGALFRALPGRKHPNHRPGPGVPRKSVRQKLLRLTEYGVDTLMTALEDGSLVCAHCQKELGKGLTLDEILRVVDKGAKYSVGTPTDDDEGRPIASPVVLLPALDPGR